MLFWVCPSSYLLLCYNREGLGFTIPFFREYCRMILRSTLVIVITHDITSFAHSWCEAVGVGVWQGWGAMRFVIHPIQIKKLFRTNGQEFPPCFYYDRETARNRDSVVQFVWLFKRQLKADVNWTTLTSHCLQALQGVIALAYFFTSGYVLAPSLDTSCTKS